MIDVFLKLWPQHQLRWLMAGLVAYRLSQFADARLRILHPASLADDPRVRRLPTDLSWLIEIPDERFHVDAKVAAAKVAGSPVYVVLDDDHLPLGWDWLVRGVATLQARPEFAMLASWSVNDEVSPVVVGRSVATPFEDDDVFETFALGTPYFVSRDRVAPRAFDRPNTTPASYDGAMSDRIRENGRLGFLKRVRHNHLGIGFSTVVPGHWTA